MNIGILGCGTIGGGVLAMIDGLGESSGMKVTKVFDIPEKKSIIGDRLVSDPDLVCCANDVDVVVEAMGGNEFPYNCIKKALTSGKHVVTSNKEVVSLHMPEFYKLAKNKGVSFMCEASVGGGIPIICSLIDNIKINDVNHIYGIINGTTNFILTRMKNDGMEFMDAVKLAQEKGFAERDPSADLMGLDMIRKICILSSIAYKGYISYEKVSHRGIEKLTKEILSDITEKGYMLKLCAESRLCGDNLKISVEPVLITADNGLSSVNDEYNAVYFEGEKNGLLGFTGKGAGRFPTASAIVGDILKIADKRKPYYFEDNKKFNIGNYVSDSRYYIYNKGTGSFYDTVTEEDIENAEFAARIF